MTTDTNVISITRKPEKTTDQGAVKSDYEKRKEREEARRQRENRYVKWVKNLGKA